MNVGFDLDKIFINYPPFMPPGLIDFFYKKKSNGELLYRIPSRPEQILRQLSHYYLLRPPIQQNIELAKKIVSNKKHTYFLISSRFGFLTKETDIIIKRYGLSDLFKNRYFNINNQQPHLFKDKMIKKLNINVFIDDDLPLLVYLADKNKDTYFYWLNNKKSIGIDKNLMAIKSLTEIQLS